MMQSTLITTFLLLLLAVLIKATNLGMKLLIMAGAGLAGMYMIHLLAQDYNKYQTLNRPGRSVSDLFKRAIVTPEPVAEAVTQKQIFPFLNFEKPSTQTLLEDIKAAEENKNKMFSLERILSFDPTGCAQRYVCTISAKSSSKWSTSERNVIKMIRALTSSGKPDAGQSAFKWALDLGRKVRDAQRCATEYPKCAHTLSQMLTFVGFAG